MGGRGSSFDQLKEQSGFRRFESDLIAKEGMNAININTGEEFTLSQRQAEIYNKYRDADFYELEYLSTSELNTLNYLKEDIGINPGKERTFYRTGNPAELGRRSHNYREDIDEKGISVYFTPKATSFAGSASNIWYHGKGKQVGWGSDDEPLIVPTGKWKRYNKKK